jgi:hypothetical protein
MARDEHGDDLSTRDALRQRRWSLVSVLRRLVALGIAALAGWLVLASAARLIDLDRLMTPEHSTIAVAVLCALFGFAGFIAAAVYTAIADGPRSIARLLRRGG